MEPEEPVKKRSNKLADLAAIGPDQPISIFDFPGSRRKHAKHQSYDFSGGKDQQRSAPYRQSSVNIDEDFEAVTVQTEVGESPLRKNSIAAENFETFPDALLPEKDPDAFNELSCFNKFTYIFRILGALISFLNLCAQILYLMKTIFTSSTMY